MHFCEMGWADECKSLQVLVVCVCLDRCTEALRASLGQKMEEKWGRVGQMEERRQLSVAGGELWENLIGWNGPPTFA